jgi:phage repressor protein C with HTH and peptisase S24 domain
MKPKKSISITSPKHEINLREAFAERLRQATKNHEIAVLASKVGVTPATLYRWLNAKFDPSIPKLAELAQAMNVNLAWLVTGQGPIDARQADRHALLEQYDTTKFESATGPSGKAPLAFYEPWLFKLLYGSQDKPTVSGPTDMNSPLLIEVGDDSMEPSIAKGDLLLIDRSFGLSPAARQQAMREARSAYDGMCAFRSGSPNGEANRPTGHLIIRRIQYRLDGTLVIRCDNPRYPEEVYPPKKIKPPVPVGRVIWRGGRI